MNQSKIPTLDHFMKSSYLRYKGVALLSSSSLILLKQLNLSHYDIKSYDWNGKIIFANSNSNG